MLGFLILLCSQAAFAETEEEVRAFHEFTQKVMESNTNDPEEIRKHYENTLAPAQRKREEDAAKTGKVDPKPFSGGNKNRSGDASAPALPSDQPTELFIFTPSSKKAEKPAPGASSTPRSAELKTTGLGSLQSGDVSPGWSFGAPKPVPSVKNSK